MKGYRWTFAVLALFAQSTWAATYYVSTTGNDSHDGTLNKPFQTIQKAADTVRAGDTIEVLAGTYRENVRIGRLVGRGIGRADAWITLKPHDRAKVKVEYYHPQFKGDLNAGINLNTFWFFPVHCDVEGDSSACVPVYWSIEGLEITGGALYNVKIDAPEVKILQNNIHDSGADLIKLVRTANDVAIEGNELHHPKPVPVKGSGNLPNAQAIDIVGADRTHVANNYIHDIPSVGMFAKGNARNTIIENNRFEHIYGRAIQLGQLTGASFLKDGKYETYDGIVRHNIIRNSDDVCLATASSKNARIYGNQCINVGMRSDDPKLRPRAAIYVAKESEVGQAGTDVEIRDNLIVLAPNAICPFVQVAPGAMTDDSTLRIDNNIYWQAGKTKAGFTWEDKGIYNASFDEWQRNARQDVKSRIAPPHQKAETQSVGVVR